MDAQTLKGMAVVSMQEGVRLGRVEQALFDVAARRLCALEVHGDSGSFVVPFALIERIGDDAIMVTSSQVTQTPTAGSPEGTLLGLHALGKLKVVDQAGTLLGTLNTIEFDPVDGGITRLSVHTGGLLGLGGTTTELAAADIVVIGPELLTVSTAVGDTLPAP